MNLKKNFFYNNFTYFSQIKLAFPRFIKFYRGNKTLKKIRQLNNYECHQEIRRKSCRYFQTKFKFVDNSSLFFKQKLDFPGIDKL